MAELEYKIFKASKISGYLSVSDERKVSKDEFLEVLDTKVKQLTKKDPSEYPLAISLVKEVLFDRKYNMAVRDVYFYIKGNN